jgi:hypothetical protein
VLVSREGSCASRHRRACFIGHAASSRCSALADLSAGDLRPPGIRMIAGFSGPAARDDVARASESSPARLRDRHNA